MAGTMRALPLLVVLAVALPARAQQHDPCAGVRCGAHGVCVSEVQEAYCFCDEGFEAVGRACVRAPVRRHAVTIPASDVGARIVGLASAEDGRDLANVGRGRASMEPGPLARYVAPGGLWCSDFVSWVYRAAGVPFTGGYHGGWMLPNNVAIRRWFVRRSAWVAHDDAGYRSFAPSPGDYVRIRTSTWGHSAIVRAVVGDTLHLVEGNARGHVRLIRYEHFRQHERIEGFGLVRLAQSYRPRRS